MYSLIITIIVIANGAATSTTEVQGFDTLSRCEEAKAVHVKNVTKAGSGFSVMAAASCVKRHD